jgi:hypothetical protein
VHILALIKLILAIVISENVTLTGSSALAQNIEKKYGTMKGDQNGIERKVSKKNNDEGIRTTMYDNNHTLDYIAVDKYLAKVQERCDECRLVLVCHTDSHILNYSTR